MKRLFIAIFLILSFACISIAEDVELAWDANSESDLIGYNVYRSTTPDGQLIGNVEENPFFLDYVLCYMNDSTCAGYVDLNVPYDTTFYWIVTAIDSSGNESDKSNEVSYHTASEPDTTPPGDPTGCYIKAVVP